MANKLPEQINNMMVQFGMWRGLSGSTARFEIAGITYECSFSTDGKDFLLYNFRTKEVHRFLLMYNRGKKYRSIDVFIAWLKNKI